MFKDEDFIELAPFFSWQPSPQRTLKVKMTYENRAKINLSIGIAVDTNATEPLRVVKMYHFQNNGFFGPMLGTWADDSSHKEPIMKRKASCLF